MTASGSTHRPPHVGFGDLALYAVPLLLLLAVTLSVAHGGLYTLDDPYIHLALARRIAEGHYGINLGEFSAPSSSILWPLLLAPFAAWDGYLYVPLALNLAFVVGCAALLHEAVEPSVGAATAPWVTLAGLFLFNVNGVAFTGMEHTLQLLLTLIIARGVLRDQLGPAALVAAALLPLVRYEGLAITMPVLLALAWRRRSARPLVALGASLLALAAFSAFLHGLGLGWLPTSVLAKTTASVVPPEGLDLLQRAAWHWRRLQPYSMLLLALVAILGGRAAWRAGDRERAVLIVVPAALYLAFGKFGWFGRYEIAALMFALLLALPYFWTAAPGSGRRVVLVAMVATLALGTVKLWSCTLVTPLAARNIQDQQVQMADIADTYLAAPIAVNDLGAVAYRSADRYVLDLWGLANLDALHARQSQTGPGWIEALMRAHQVRYAFVFDAWIREHPANWIRVGALRIDGPLITPPYASVSLYATDPDAARQLAAALDRYQRESQHARDVHIDRDDASRYTAALP